MVENLYNFEKVLKHISVNEDICKPNLTTKLSIEAAQDELKNNISILDLGCGSGIIGIALMKNFPGIEMHCSDVDENAIDVHDLEKSAEDAPVVKLVNLILID